MKRTQLSADGYLEEVFQPTAKMLYIVAEDCKSFCKQWQDSNKEQVECLTNSKCRLVYCQKVGPGKYDLKFTVGDNRVIEWFGSACCSYAALAKAYQSYYDECY